MQFEIKNRFSEAPQFTIELPETLNKRSYVAPFKTAVVLAVERKACLKESYLPGADLTKLNLSGTDLEGVDLSGIDFS